MLKGIISLLGLLALGAFWGFGIWAAVKSIEAYQAGQILEAIYLVLGSILILKK